MLLFFTLAFKLTFFSVSRIPLGLIFSTQMNLSQISFVCCFCKPSRIWFLQTMAFSAKECER